jgi:hypothetical protein
VERKPPRRSIAAVMTLIAITCAPTAAADDPTSILCKNPTYQFTHREACEPPHSGNGPPGAIPGSGGGGSGGLLGLIHSLTGGLL